MPRPARVRAVGFGWRHAGRRAWALHDLKFEIEPGERVLLLGASGSGKSTLVGALAGVLGGEDEGEQLGELLVDGVPAAAARGRVGLVLQDPDAQVVLERVGDDVAFGCENLGVPREQIWPRVAEALDDVGLAVGLRHPTSDLSGGQKQRLALAGVLAMRPGLLVLDEPTANLDPEGVEEVRDAVSRSLDRNGATLVVIEHRVDVWRPIVDRVIVLDRTGAILADGPTEAILGRRGAELAAAGIWIPEFPPGTPPNRSIERDDWMLRATALSVGYSRPVRKGVDLQLSASGLLAITGRNGSGKSALALTLGGLSAPLAGTVAVSDRVAGGLSEHPHRWRSRQLVSRIGTVFQNPEHQFVANTVRSELSVGPRAAGASRALAEARVSELLERLGLAAVAEANPFTLSGGEQRRLSVGTALATDPKILILDEPTFGQDSLTWAALVALLAEQLDGGTAIAAVTHDRAFADALATRTLDLSSAGSTVKV